MNSSLAVRHMLYLWQKKSPWILFGDTEAASNEQTNKESATYTKIKLP